AADGGRMVGAGDAVARAAEIHGARAERVAGTAGHETRQVRLAMDHLRRRRPIRPLGLALDRFHAGPSEAFAADADAVTHRLAAAHHQVEVGVRRVDDDRPGRLAGPVVEDLAAKIVARGGRILLGISIGRRRYRLALPAEQRLERIEWVGGSRTREVPSRDKDARDRGDGLQTGKIVHGTSPFDDYWSNGEVPGFKMPPENQSRLGYRLRPKTG